MSHILKNSQSKLQPKWLITIGVRISAKSYEEEYHVNIVDVIFDDESLGFLEGTNHLKTIMCLCLPKRRLSRDCSSIKWLVTIVLTHMCSHGNISPDW